MTCAPAAPAKNIKNVAARNNTTKISPERTENMIEYDQYRLDLHAMKDVILELRDSL